jgi:hypothetical protein
MLGFSEGELRSKHCVQFSPREDAEVDWALFQQLRAGSVIIINWKSGIFDGTARCCGGA